MLYGLGAVISAAVAVYCFYSVRQETSPTLLIVGIVFTVLTIIFGALFLSGRINKTEDIHVTE